MASSWNPALVLVDCEAKTSVGPPESLRMFAWLCELGSSFLMTRDVETVAVLVAQLAAAEGDARDPLQLLDLDAEADPTRKDASKRGRTEEIRRVVVGGMSHCENALACRDAPTADCRVAEPSTRVSVHPRHGVSFTCSSDVRWR
jgi:hypothetical protein